MSSLQWNVFYTTMSSFIVLFELENTSCWIKKADCPQPPSLYLSSILLNVSKVKTYESEFGIKKNDKG